MVLSATVPHAAEYRTAAALGAMVKEGNLPPRTERLPEKPYVEALVNGVGKYGGTIRSAVLGGGDHYNLTGTIGNETLVRWTPDWSKIVPSIAERAEVSSDAKEYTFVLR